MTWKYCKKLCCYKEDKTTENIVKIGSDLEEVHVHSNTFQQTETAATNQCTDAASNETQERLAEDEAFEHQDLNDQRDNINVNEQNECFNALELSGNFHNTEENKRSNEREDRRLNIKVDSLCSHKHKHEDRLLENNLETFLNDLCANIEIKRPDDDVDAIRDAVEELVNSLLCKVGEYEPILKSSELVPTGSCYDGTKIIQPNEFDFLAAIDCLSSNNLTTAVFSTESCSAGGYAHAVYTNSSPEWSRVIEQDGDHCVIACLRSRSLRTIFRERFHYVLLNEIERISVENSKGLLTLTGFSVPINGPQCSVKVVWKPKESSVGLPIDIDVSPAIKCTLKNDFTKSDVIGNDVFDALSKEKYVYLIPRPVLTCTKCFKMVFPHSDQRLVMELSESHRKVLLILKYLSHEVLKFNFRLKTVFNSFAMKIAVLHHSAFCRETPRQSTKECLMVTLDYIKFKLNKQCPELTSVFNVSRNVWKNAEEQEINIARAILRKITELFNEVKIATFRHLEFDDLKREFSLVCSNSVPLSSVSNCLPEKNY